MNRRTTSIKVSPDLWKRVKLEAVKNDLQISDLVETVLNAYFISKYKT